MTRSTLGLVALSFVATCALGACQGGGEGDGGTVAPPGTTGPEDEGDDSGAEDTTTEPTDATTEADDTASTADDARDGEEETTDVSGRDATDDGSSSGEDVEDGGGAEDVRADGETSSPGDIDSDKVACCRNNQCSMWTPEACQRSGGSIEEGTCSSNPCPKDPEDMGACCFQGACQRVKRETCRMSQGTFFSGRSCSSSKVSCGTRVPCCLNTACQVMTEQTCRNQGGTPRPNASGCGSNVCSNPPMDAGPGSEDISLPSNTGACCRQGQCYDRVPRNDCQRGGGTFFDGKKCSDASVSCQAPCCVNNTCKMLSGQTCQSRGGTLKPQAGSCGQVQCNSGGPRPCCIDGTCKELTESKCRQGNGRPAPSNTSSCQDITCPDTPCCFGGKCIYTRDATLCQARVGGEPHPNKTCSQVSCSPPSGSVACCKRVGCLDLRPATCRQNNGTVKSGKTCNDNPC